MRAFYVVLFVTILWSVELIKSDEVQGQKEHTNERANPDDSIEVGVLIDISKKGKEDILSASNEISRTFAEDALSTIKAASLTTKTADFVSPLLKTKAGERFLANAGKFAANSLKFATKLIPYASEALDLVQGLVETFDSGEDWKDEFLETAEKQAKIIVQYGV